ncbi:MAG: hypothetical protein MUF87_17155 [Anaerolineae bacterium]|jgi:hypothetical protein|nr:hypothetical protein [Anaerolineae bacterium]
MTVLQWINRHPRLSGWIVLSLGMVIMLFLFAGDVGLLPLQWVALIIATVLVSGLCIWIIGTDDDQKTPEPITQIKTPEPPKTE